MTNNKKYITEAQLKQEIKKFEQLQDKIYAEFAANVQYTRKLFETKNKRLERRNSLLCILIIVIVIAITILFSFHAEH